MPLKVGVTGGIGSGKSTVCKVFGLLGIPVFEADLVAKELLNTNDKIKQKLIDLYGEEIYTRDGTIDRKKLADIIFNDDIQLAKVNNIVHPVVREEYHTWNDKQNSPYTIHEAAILFESGFYKMMDFTILVSADEKERIQRVAKRDGVTNKQVEERINKQWSDEQKLVLATKELKNNNRELLIPQILKIDKDLKEYGKIW